MDAGELQLFSRPGVLAGNSNWKVRTNLWWGSLRRGGQRKVADRIVGKMKNQLFKKR